MSQFGSYTALKAGDNVAIIAPSARCQDDILVAIQDLLTSWGLVAQIPEPLFGDDLLCSNQLAVRFDHLRAALINPAIKAIWSVRGGYGAMQLLPALETISKPISPKLVIGFSDVTAIHLYLQKNWQWPSVHGPSARQTALAEIDQRSIQALHSLLFKTQSSLTYPVIPLNQAAKQSKVIHSTLTGGNLCLVQSSMGTNWQIYAAKKMILLEEVNERGYRIDRMFEQLKQAHVFANCDGVLLGDFTGGDEPAGKNFVKPVLQRFADESAFPVFQIAGVGHGKVNQPLLLGTTCVIDQGLLTLPLA